MLWSILLAALAATPAPETCNGVDDDFDGQIDESAICLGCTRLTVNAGHSYLACTLDMPDQGLAAQACDDLGYHLANVAGSEQVTVEAALSVGESYWLGWNDEAVEGVLVGTDGLGPTSTEWAPGEPNGGPLANCVQLTKNYLALPGTAGWRWVDVPCVGVEARPLCEVECQPVTWYHDEDGDGFGQGSPVTSCGPRPANAAAASGDCDDAESSIRPGAFESCDGIDNDCDGTTDEGIADADGDGWLTCQGDCDDDDPEVNPEGIELCDGVDQNCDGTPDDGFDLDGDGVDLCAGDCDDGDPDVHAGAEDLPNGEDDDCDGFIDVLRSYVDGDGDGFGDPGSVGYTGPGAVGRAGDCADFDPARHIGADEVCNGVDDDCDGWIDDGVCTGCDVVDAGGERWLRCRGVRRMAEAWRNCEARGWQLASPEDATAQDALHAVAAAGTDLPMWIGPNDLGEEDVLTTPEGLPTSLVYDLNQPGDDGAGQDCSAVVRRSSSPRVMAVHDRDCAEDYGYICQACEEQAWFADLDGDGAGAGLPEYSCVRPADRVELGGDCDDADPAVRPGVAESCDGIDNDCDGEMDEGPVLIGPDADGDGWSDASSASLAFACPPLGPLATLGDCDDGDGDVAPGLLELCDGIDQDCDGRVDDDLACAGPIEQRNGFLHRFRIPDPGLSWSAARADCQGDPGWDLAVIESPEEQTQLALEVFSRRQDDWWFGLQNVGGTWTWIDTSAAVYTRWANDQPNNPSVQQCGDYIAQSWPNGRWNDATCSDPNPWICEADCAGVAVYRDADGDGDGDPASARLDCGPSTGWALTGTDCDDGDPTRAGRFAELCDGLDNDCDGATDEGTTTTNWFVDPDGDGYGAGLPLAACARPEGHVALVGDCDNTDPDVFPGQVELCDGIDQDCDLNLDEDAADGTPGFLDLDGDGFGEDASASAWCTLPLAFTAVGGDCDDGAPDVSPAEIERCGGGDEDCDGLVDDEDDELDPLAVPTWYVDFDDDGWGTSFGSSALACVAPSGFGPDGDCNDTTDAVNPDATEIPGDGIDQDCDGFDPPADTDTDGDGLTDLDELALGSDPERADTDGDGVGDADEVDPGPVARDTDGDGLPDAADPDDDGDGVPTAEESTLDTDGDGLADFRDPDSDDDGALDGSEGTGDADQDGLVDRLDPGGVASVRQPSEPAYGCGCATGGPGAWLGLGLVGALVRRRSRAT